MKLTLAQKIIKNHLVSGNLFEGREVTIRIDQTLTQDSTGTMAYLQFEQLGKDRVETELSVSYVDHNMLQTGYQNADDHYFLQTIAARYGIHFSRPGNGVCHQVHLERFSRPGSTLLGSDSHTPTSGGVGMLAIGAGGMDVALAMAGESFTMPRPQIIHVNLTGRLPDWVTAKDVILTILGRLSVSGGVGSIIEYGGEALSTLTVPERATLTNMGAELGATTSIFPSDEITRQYFIAQSREEDFIPLAADEGATYDRVIEVNLSELVPMVAKPYSPDNVVPAEDLSDVKISQVCIGSCTNSSYIDMMRVAEILRNRTVHPEVSLAIAPGSKQVLTMLAESGGLAAMLTAGARLLESGCGPCIGMGQAPRTDGASLRTINRNFYNRSGTASAKVYLCSPEVAVVSALTGGITDPRRTDYELPQVETPAEFTVNDNMIIPPLPIEAARQVEIVRGPNIQPFPVGKAPEEGDLTHEVLIVLGDDISTDHIMPSTAALLPFRSNVPKLAQHCLEPCDPTFPQRAQEAGGGFIVAGKNYGQGSSREHAALAPVQLGIRAVIAISFARIHLANLINNGILPFNFIDPADYDLIEQGDILTLPDLAIQIREAGNGKNVKLINETKGKTIELYLPAGSQQIEYLLHGGRLLYTKTRSKS